MKKFFIFFAFFAAFFVILPSVNAATINIEKINTDGENLEKAQFILTGYDEDDDDIIFDQNVTCTGCLDYYADNEELFLTSDLTTMIIDGLPDGTYILVEETAPNGYQNNNIEYTFRLVNGVIEDPEGFDIDESNPNTIVIINAKLPAVAIEKVDNANKGVKDAEFSLTGRDMDGKKVIFLDTNCEGCKLYSLDESERSFNFTSNGTAMYLIGLPDGTYTLKETKTPDGYKKNTTTYEFTIENGLIEESEGFEINASNPNTILIVNYPEEDPVEDPTEDPVIDSISNSNQSDPEEKPELIDSVSKEDNPKTIDNGIKYTIMFSTVLTLIILAVIAKKSKLN